jgi:DNA mismatch repair protein MutS
MHLGTDEQTIDDLSIFGKRKQAGIYELYNRTHTRGGESLLKSMFQQPLSDMDAINRRSTIISQMNVPFPFEAALFDGAEKYLAHADDKQHALGEKDIQNGVSAIIRLLQQMKDLTEMPAIKSITAYEPERALSAALLADPAFAPALAEKGKLSYTAVTAYDVLFRVQEHEKIKALLQHIYQLDVYISVAKVAVEKSFIFPTALAKGSGMLKLEGVYHPELTRPVGNNVSMSSYQNVIFLTGANMAGKSTFLRAVSTALYIAHIGFPVAAKAMEFSVLDGIYTTINLPDNLGIGASHFYNEVLRVKKMAQALHENKALYVVFDELFRGTNVKDAHEATVAVTSAFARKSNSLFIISSHIVEAGEELKQQQGIGFRYLPTRMNGHQPEYTYTLEEGITDDRHGMIIIRNEGILDTLKKGKK